MNTLEQNAVSEAALGVDSSSSHAGILRGLSESRLRANRENAQSSTGPRTKEGKKRSSLNSTRHGILAQVIHLPEEEMAAFTEFTKEYVGFTSARRRCGSAACQCLR
jgi:hypothetical protein